MKNINKQEELVSALWDFAKGLQKSDMKYPIKSIDKNEYETKMDSNVLHEAIVRIAKNFNLEIQEIQ